MAILTPGLLEVVVDGNSADPAGLLSLVLEVRLVSLVKSAGKSSGFETGVGVLVNDLWDCDSVVVAADGLPVSHCG